MGARLVALALAVAPLAAVACPGSAAPLGPGVSSSLASTAVPATALAVAAAPVSAFSRNFNPFDHDAVWRDGIVQFIYEPLVEYDGAQDNQYYPWLASSWTFSSSGQNVTFDLRPGIRWLDGSPLTATDVAYTFNLVKADPALAGGLPVVSAVANGARVFTLTLDGPAYSYLYQIAQVPIVKAGYAGKSRSITGYVDQSPDGTGPYRLAPRGFSPGRVVLSARPGYWQGPPPISALSFPALPTRPAISAALLAGRLDWAQEFMPDVQAYVQKNSTDDHFWFVADSCTVMALNLSGGALARLAVRRAISNALDRSALSLASSGGYDLPAADASGLVLPRDAQYLPPGGGTALSAHSRLAATALIMRSAGYQRSGSSYWHDKSGHEVSIDILAEEGTPLATLATTSAAQLRKAGFAASSSAMAPAQLARALAGGHYDAAILAGDERPSPYFEYEEWFAGSPHPAQVTPSTKSSRPATAHGAPSVATLARSFLSSYASSPPGSSAATGALQHLAALAAANLPVVPLVYGVAWGEFSTRHAQGWPASADPYEPAVPAAPLAEYTVLQLSPGV